MFGIEKYQTLQGRPQTCNTLVKVFSVLLKAHDYKCVEDFKPQIFTVIH